MAINVYKVEDTGDEAQIAIKVIDHAVSKRFRLSKGEYSIITHRSNDYFERVTKPLFFVKNKKSGKFLFCLKIYELARLPSVTSIESTVNYLNEKSFKYLKLATPYTIYTSECHLFSITKYVQGDSANIYIRNIAEGIDKTQSIEDSITTYKLLACSLAELHQLTIPRGCINTIKISGFDEFYDAIDFTQFPTAFELLKILEEEFNDPKLHDPKQLRFIHTDPSPDNLLLDKNAKTLHIIDTEEISVGHTALDLTKATLSLELQLVQRNIPMNISNQLIDAFYKTYTQQMKDKVHSMSVMRTFETLFWLRKCLRLHLFYASENGENKDILSRTSQYTNGKLQSLLEQYNK